jgi:hypothetical protein
VFFSHHPLGVAGSGSAGHTLFAGVTIAMVRPLEEIARRDRRWFRAHPERQYRCRSPALGELDRYACCQSLIITVRHIGRGHLAYQPVIFEGQLASDEKSAGVLFALAAKTPRSHSHYRRARDAPLAICSRIASAAGASSIRTLAGLTGEITTADKEVLGAAPVWTGQVA